MLKRIRLGIFGLILSINQIVLADEVSMSQIKHVVVVMLENRSFDNILAWLYNKGEAPKNFSPPDTDPHFLGLTEDTQFTYTNTLVNSLGKIVFSCHPIKGVPSVGQTKLLNSPKFDPNEPFGNVTNQIYGFDGGIFSSMSGFLQDYASTWEEDDWLDQLPDICAVMETYTDEELPYIYGLAKNYAVSDLWFSSVPTQTNPNRAFSVCGTSEGQIVNGFLGRSTFTADTVWNRLDELSPQTTWMIFWQPEILPILFPGPFTVASTFKALNRIKNLDSHYDLMDRFHTLAREGQLPHFSFIEPQWTISFNDSSKEGKKILKVKTG